MSAQHVQAGRIGGLVSASRQDPHQMTAAARAGRAAKLADRLRAEVLAEATEDLAEQEIARRVEAKRRAYWQRLSAKGTAALRAKTAAKRGKS